MASACRKDEPVINVHSGLTRIEYSVSDPFEMPHLEFSFKNTCDLSSHTQFAIEIMRTDESGRLNLMVMLEDEEGHMNDADPMLLTEDDIQIDETKSIRYDFDLLEYELSVTGTNGVIDLSRIVKMHIYVNAGLSGVLGSGTFWIDRIEFIKP